ncbi:HEPN domain-containing protein [Duganella aceris]|uniref:RiboL-PSP-HEPN domain-containing protein n=1 Tax=Duganella aceris TaxID=2703883 RepID=A0ABX0FG45_9BURK|nr:HEPN domain-containing protein [Duganella aceris]NGZ83529.1 hypothetical protein [Duganella aceris]
MSPKHILPSEAYLRLREQIQQTFDFAYIVCQAVPCLKQQMSLIKKGVLQNLPSPDYFSKPNDLALISEQIKEYKAELSRHAILSSFSYFEAYVVDAIKKFIEFHGGENQLHKSAIGRVQKTIIDQRKTPLGSKRVLQKNLSKDALKAVNATKILEGSNFKFPSELFYPLGLKYLSQKIGNLKASEIPTFLIDAFGMPLSDDLVEKFHAIRDIRNKIAHGQKVELIIKDVAEYNSILRDLALSIDRHLVDNFYISEKYR